jgi:hypothetical protein
MLFVPSSLLFVASCVSVGVIFFPAGLDTLKDVKLSMCGTRQLVKISDFAYVHNTPARNFPMCIMARALNYSQSA